MRPTLAAMKFIAVSLAAALLLPACATHPQPHRAVKPLRRAPGETADEFAERKQEVKDYAAEVRQTQKENAEEAKEKAVGASSSPPSGQ